MALVELKYVQRDFSAGQVTATAERRDDVKLVRSGLKRADNARILASGALKQRFGRSAYRLDTGRIEKIRIDDDNEFEFVFGHQALRIYDGHGDLLNEIGNLPWTLETIGDIRYTQAERDVVVTFPGTRPYRFSWGLSALPAAGAGIPIGDMLDQQTFPAVNATATSNRTSQGTTHTVTLPSGITAGDLLIAVLAVARPPDGGPTVTLPSGWNMLRNYPGGFRLVVAARIADGTEGASFNFTTSGSVRSAHNTYRISGHRGTPEVAVASGSGTSTNPPNLVPSWGNAANLWLAVSAREDSGVGSTPANYTNSINSGSMGNTGAGYVICGSARRNLKAVSEDPGSFGSTGNSQVWIGATIAIQSSAIGLDSAFDGETSKNAASCIRAVAQSAYIGLDLSASPHPVQQIAIYGSNNRGFIANTNGTDTNPSVTLTVRGKNGSLPTSASDGANLGTVTFTDTANESAGRIIFSTDTVTAYDYVWVQIEHNAGADRNIYVAQLEITLSSEIAVEQWSFQTFQFDRTASGAKRQPYVRYAPRGISLTPSARTGAITVTFNQPVLDGSHEGVSFRYHGRELIITEVTNSLTASANVIETLPPTMRVTCANAAERDSFQIGQVVIGQTTGSEGLIVAFNSTANLDVIMDKGASFAASERIVSETGVATVSGTPSATTTAGSVVWDEAAMSNFRGWPRNADYDRSRLVFCDFPQAPRAIAWSAVGAITDFKVGAEGDDAMLEFAPGNGRVLHVQGGADQFVLTDQGVLYIPISEANPLAPGSVSFRPIAAVGSSGIKPVSMHEGLVYVAANNKSLIAIVPTGQTAQPYRVSNVSEFHSDLFTGVRVLAAMTGGGDQAEQYLWVGQDDGTALVGRFDPSNEWVGFVPVTGDGTIMWISSLGGTVHFSTRYQADNTIDWVLEHLDPSAYLDGAVTLNNPGAALAGEPGEGPLWFYAGLTVDLMDGDEYLGARAVDENGDLVELAGDDFSAATVVAGFAFTVTVLPWLPDLPEGEERGQRARRRRVAQAAAVVRDATKFTLMGREFGAPDAKASGIYRAPGQMRAFDPSIVLTKSEPGPITILELNGRIVG